MSNPGVPALPAQGSPTFMRPRRLWWMYLLVVLALAALGGGAAQSWQATHDTKATVAANVCLVLHGVTMPELAQAGARTDPVAASQLRGPIHGCLASLTRHQGKVMLVGAVLMLAAAWLLMLAGGWRTRWRLRRRGSALSGAAVGEAAEARFGQWCDALGLAGRRRPEILLAAPGRGTAEAFTTGLPAGRPLVVVPIACAYGDRGAFDVTVLHELAHVRSRDLTWASAVGWTGWLIVPTLLLAASPYITRPARLLADYGSSLWLAVALSVALLLLRAAVLRRRELTADWHATAILGDSAALAAALRQQAAAVRHGGRLRAAARSMTALHPEPATRISAEAAALDLAEGGWGVTAAAGLLAMFTYQALAVILFDMLGPGAIVGASARLTLAVSCLLWASVVVPAWARRAAAASWAGLPAAWAAPLSGAIVGLVAGYCLQIPGAFSAVGPAAFGGHRLLLVGVLVIVSTGVVVLAAGAAAAAGGSPARHWLALAGALAASGTSTAIALGVMSDVLYTHVALRSPALDRWLIDGEGGGWLWSVGTLVLVAGLVAASPAAAATGRQVRRAARLQWLADAADRVVPRACWPTVGMGAAVGGAGAALSWQLRIRAGLPAETTSFWDIQRYWICALAGWAVAAVIMLGRPGGPRPAAVPAGTSPALAAGFATTILAALTETAAAWTTGRPHGLATLAVTSQSSTWLLFVLAVLTLPPLTAAAAALNRARPSRPARPRRLAVAPAAGMSAAALSLALMTGILAPVTTAPRDQQQASHAMSVLRAEQRAASTSPVGAQPRTPTTERAAGRRLRPRAARAALSGIPRFLPSGWKQFPNTPDHPLTGIRPASCQSQLTRDVGQQAPPSTADITENFSFPLAGIQGHSTLTVSVTSYEKAAPGFAQHQEDEAACTHAAKPNKHAVDGLTHFSITAGPVPGPPGNVHFLNFYSHTLLRASGYEFILRTFDLGDEIAIGHNEASATISFSYASPVPEIQHYAPKLVLAVLTTIIRRLASSPGPGPRAPASHDRARA
jgi:hypothetical protein